MATTNANWTGSVLDRKSTSSYPTVVGEIWLHGGVRNKK